MAKYKTEPTIRYTTSVWTSAISKNLPADLTKFRQADVKGSIESGKYADLTVLSDDIFTMPR